VGDAAAYSAHPELAREARVGVGHIGGGLLVAGVDHAQAGGVGRNQERVQAVAAECRDKGHAHALKQGDRSLSTVHDSPLQCSTMWTCKLSSITLPL